jgi:hypothetical protein
MCLETLWTKVLHTHLYTKCQGRTEGSRGRKERDEDRIKQTPRNISPQANYTDGATAVAGEF